MKKFLKWFVPGLVLGIVLILAGNRALVRTSTNQYCISCHIHPEADASWKKSVHYETRSGFRIACVDCHLPPKGHGYLWAKGTTGLRDLWSKWTKDSASFNWTERRRLENARAYAYESSCIKCHENLFPLKLTKAGEDAHLYYKQKKNSPDLHCINCHLNAGHYIEGYTHGSNKTFGATSSAPKEIFKEPAKISEFKSFTEQIPQSSVSFRMIAIPGGTFKMGSPSDEPFRKSNEQTPKEVEISRFFMAEIEVSWEEYLAFYKQTGAEGRTTDTEGLRKTGGDDVDAISGATPPYGQPDQGWGMGKRPVISISYHAAETYCKWLSLVTKKRYRLPTEAEWEYACRAGTTTPYFFPGNPKDFQKTGLRSRLSGNDTTGINTYVVYKSNSSGRTQEPEFVKPNPFGLRNMAGNVAEFCSDWYTDNPFSGINGNIIKDPAGPEYGTEHVIRGGSYFDPAGNLRSAVRDSTRTEDWLKTDPQMPKSIWWYSDCFYVGFRVVCEFDDKNAEQVNQ
jgi:formylglycine-generating enzyme